MLCRIVKYIMCDSIIRRANGQTGYVPSNYVRETEPAKVIKKVKKVVVEEVPVTIKKRQIVRRRAPMTSRRTRTFSCKFKNANVNFLLHNKLVIEHTSLALNWAVLPDYKHNKVVEEYKCIILCIIIILLKM